MPLSALLTRRTPCDPQSQNRPEEMLRDSRRRRGRGAHRGHRTPQCCAVTESHVSKGRHQLPWSKNIPWRSTRRATGRDVGKAGSTLPAHRTGREFANAKQPCVCTCVRESTHGQAGTRSMPECVLPPFPGGSRTSHCPLLSLQFTGNSQPLCCDRGNERHRLEVSVCTSGAAGIGGTSDVWGAEGALAARPECPYSQKDRGGQAGEGTARTQGPLRRMPATTQTPHLPAAPRVQGAQENLWDLRHLSAQKGPAGPEAPALRQLPAGR